MKNKEKKLNIGHYLKKYKWGIFFYILTVLIGGVCGIFYTILLANSIELITLGEFMKAVYTLLGVIGIVVVQRVSYYICNQIYYSYSNKIMADLNYDLARQAFKLNSKTYNDHDTGTFVQRIVSDPERIVDNMAGVIDMFTDIVVSFVMVIYIMTLNIWTALILLSTVIIGFAIEFNRVKVRRKNRSILRKKNDQINSLTTEIVRSEKDIKSLGLEERLSEVSNSNYQDYRKTRQKSDRVDYDFWCARTVIIEIVAIGVLIFGIWLMDLGLLTLASFMIIYSNNKLYTLVWGIGSVANSIIDIKVAHNRMFSLFDEDEFVTERFGTKALEDVRGEIEFKDVSYTFKEFEFKEQSAEEAKKKKHKKKAKKERVLVSENKIFNNLSFKIQPNTTVAFVGKSGSGKSTILNLMSKMYEADEGEVLIDGVNINDLNKETLRKTISLVNQFPYIFDMTIKENLLLAKGDATDEEIKDAIKKASLDEFVDSLPKNIDTKVGESGIKLSGGQKQRLAIARALLRKSNIIIFDESTSSLDNFAQEEVKKSIDGLKGKSTIVIVAHRLSTIKNVDKIFFLDSGDIVDEGTFDELYEKNDKFKAMFLAENI